MMGYTLDMLPERNLLPPKLLLCLDILSQQQKWSQEKHGMEEVI